MKREPFPPADDIPFLHDDTPIVPPPVADLQPALERAFAEVMAAAGSLQKELPGGPELTGQQRKRLFSAQARTFGFIVQARQIADARPAFRPNQLSLENMTTNLANAQQAEMLLAAIDQLRRLVDDYLLRTHDSLYRDGLSIYEQLRAMRRSRVQGADVLVQQLAEFFKSRGRRLNKTEPTRKEVERDFKKLMHGTADGEMVIRHETPHWEGGVREVSERVKE